MRLDAEIAAADFAWTIGSLCRVNRIPFDPSLVFHKFPAPHSVRQLIEALRSFGFRTGEGRLEKGAYPCVGFVAGESPRPALLLKRDAERLLYFVPGSQTAQSAPLASLKETFTGDVLLVRHESAQATEGDGAPKTSGFGFRWFWTELLRHKRIWRDVLLASFFIQLIGLAAPLWTQVVIDKVVVHQTESTLIAIAVGLGMFMLFNAGMSWLRQYFVLHTGNRVDAVLGSQVFRHLFHLHAAVLRAPPDRHAHRARAGGGDDPRVHGRRRGVGDARLPVPARLPRR